jgi:uncharacterized SAM-binding protein YcdF (DUF218 family)
MRRWFLLRRVAVIVALIWVGCGAAIVIRGLTMPTGRADAAVIFGNMLAPDGTPVRILAERLDVGVRCYHAGGCPVLFVSGSVDGPGLDEAASMRRYLLAHGVPDAAIVTDVHGDNTLATAQHAVAWLRAHSLSRVLLVSQYYHLPRAAMAFRKAGFAGLKIYADYPAHMHKLDFYAIWREVPAFAVYAIRLEINPSAQPISFRPGFLMRDLLGWLKPARPHNTPSCCA